MKESIQKDYIGYKRTSVKSEPKIKDIEFYINRFLNSSNKDLKDFGEKELIDHLNKVSPKYKVGTLNTIKAYLKNFLKWYFIDWSARFRNLDKLCRSEKAPKTYTSKDMLSKEDIEKLVQAEQNLRWKTYWLVYFYGGFRPSEVCNLKWKDIDFEKDGAFIQTFSEKNKEHFDKFLPQEVVFYLKQIKNNNSEWVFPSPLKNRKKLPITEKAVYHRLKKLSKKVFNRHINPYVLRHSIATILYNDDKIKDDDVAVQMGHTKNMKKTYSNLSKDKLRERARKIYIKPELTQEDKNEIKELKSRLNNISKLVVDVLNSKEKNKNVFYEVDGDLIKKTEKAKK